MFIAIARRDFFREAVFFFITPFWAALSRALYARGISLKASSVLPACISLFISFTLFFNSFFRLRLRACLRFDCRKAFLADLNIGISVIVEESFEEVNAFLFSLVS